MTLLPLQLVLKHLQMTFTVRGLTPLGLRCRVHFEDKLYGLFSSLRS